MMYDEFQKLAMRGYNRIPLMRTVLADLDTPLSAYLKLASGPYSYLFESVQGGEKWGRYSIIGLPCRTVVRVSGHEISVEKDGELIETAHADDPLSWIENFQARYKVAGKEAGVAGLPRFTGGMVGYFGYGTACYVEPRLAAAVDACAKSDPIAAPDILLMVSDEVLVFDNLRGALYVVIHVNPDAAAGLEQTWNKAQQRLDGLVQSLRETTPRPVSVEYTQPVKESDFISGFSRQDFESAVERAKEYIREGDVMQVVLSQRLSIPVRATPLDLYRALRSLNPSPYMFCMNLRDFHVVGSSPEILVRLEESVITVRPIAGTRRRGVNEAEDHALEQDLLADPKECAEHLMLIDLGRNDVGRVSETGSVKLTEKMLVERYSHVMHIVSNVKGQLKSGMTAIDALRATFPAGTLSGAPKVRAMEIINELEPVKRGVYGGAVGYISWSGNMDTAIAIRTAVIKDGMLHIQAGAGIVADSVPALEWEETMSKGRAIFKAVAMAEAGLDTAHGGVC